MLVMVIGKGNSFVFLRSKVSKAREKRKKTRAKETNITKSCTIQIKYANEPFMFSF